MKKISVKGNGILVLEEDREIALEQGMVKVQVKAAGICGSDLALLNGTRDVSKELYFGHEFSGVVIEAAEGSVGLEKGKRVASELSRTCGQCWNCRNNLPEYCRNMNDALLPGGFSEETLVRSEQNYGFLSPIPDTLDDITAALMEPTNCAYQIARKANVKPGDNVVVYGMGAMGCIAAVILKKLGAGSVVCVDNNVIRQMRVKDAGIADIIVNNDEEGMKILKHVCGEKGADIAIEATGAAIVLKDAISNVRPGGRIVVGSVYHQTIPEFDPLPIFRKELTIVGAKGPALHQKTDGSSSTVCLMEQIKEKLQKIIRVYEYKDAIRAFEDAKTGEAIKAVITF